jgi:hypothetical protein
MRAQFVMCVAVVIGAELGLCDHILADGPGVPGAPSGLSTSSSGSSVVLGWMAPTQGAPLTPSSTQA